MKHTQGQWKIGNHGSIVVDAGPLISKETVGFYGGDVICESIKTMADANLIAAAPEMLQALELAIRFLDHPEVKAIPFAFPVDGVITQARAAIAKAKGES